MPFRGGSAAVKFGEPAHLFTAAAGDVQAWISCRPYGAAGVSGGPNFIIGGPGLGDGTDDGFLVSSNEFPIDIEDGDEIWAAAAEDLSFAGAITLTWLIRTSREQKKQDEQDQAAEEDTARQA